MKKIRDNAFSYLYVAPLMILYSIFFLYPIFSIFYLSFFKGKIYSEKIDNFVGFENYIKLLKDPNFITVLKNTFIYIILVITIKIVVGLLLALILHKDTVINKITRTLIFIPTAMSMIAAGLVWNYIYNPEYGLVNNFLKFLHLDFLTSQWLGNPKTALISIVIIDVWQFTGFSMILLIAGIQNIPQSIFEAGKIDGTNNFTENIYITIPLIKKVFLTVILFIITSAFKVFEYIYSTTRGGPLLSTHVLGTYMYELGFSGTNITTGMTIAVFLFIISLIFSGIFLYTSNFSKGD